MDKSLCKIIKDTRSGSSDVLLKLAKLFRSHLSNTDELKKILHDSQNRFPSFAVVNSYFKNIRGVINKEDNDAIREAVMAPLKKDNIYTDIYNYAAGYLNNIRKIFVFSNSKTVLEILLLLNRYSGKKLILFATESRPKNEGRIFAKKLLHNNIKVEFGIDAQCAAFIKECDAVFAGADVILPNGSIVNKTGSLSAAIIADYFKKPFFVFAESQKASSTNKIEKKDPVEVWNYKSEKLKIRNNYFERIPPELVTYVFTENGIFRK